MAYCLVLSLIYGPAIALEIVARYRLYKHYRQNKTALKILLATTKDEGVCEKCNWAFSKPYIPSSTNDPKML